MLPEYISIGMTPDEFWHGPPILATAYRRAYKIKQENALNQELNREWRQGMYFYEALLAASPAFREFSKGINHDYPKEPLFSPESSEKESIDPAKAEMELMKAKFEAMAIAANKKLAARGEKSS